MEQTSRRATTRRGGGLSGVSHGRAAELEALYSQYFKPPIYMPQTFRQVTAYDKSIRAITTDSTYDKER